MQPWRGLLASLERLRTTRRGLQLRLRRLLDVAVLAALVTAMALCTLLLVVAGTARDVAEKTQLVHDRVQTYSMLIGALRTFQAASYSAAHFATPQARYELEVASAKYHSLMKTALALPAPTPADEELRRRLATGDQIVTPHLAGIAGVVARIDQIWRTEGGAAAGLEAERSALPVRELEALLNGAIHSGDMEIATSTQRALSINRAVLLASVFCFLLAIASWAIIHGLLRRRLGPGLRRLEEGALAFAAGDLAHRTQLGGHDELSQLSTAFDRMAQKLADKQMALRQVQLGLEDAVHRRTEELKRANHELAVSDGRRRAFLADIGHELRTPLTIIRGEAQVALRTMEEQDFNPQEAFERIIKHTHDLGRMVDDLFLIARAEAGGLPLQMQNMDLQQMAQELAGDYDALAADQGATIRALPGPPAICTADPDRLRRALTALVDNALRHTRTGVHVEIETSVTPRGVQVAVSDDGPGVDPAIVPELFQRFRRGHTRSEGSGLGLSLVRALAEAQGGSARLENRATGGLRAIIEFGHQQIGGEHGHEPAAG